MDKELRQEISMLDFFLYCFCKSISTSSWTREVKYPRSKTTWPHFKPLSLLPYQTVCTVVKARA